MSYFIAFDKNGQPHQIAGSYACTTEELPHEIARDCQRQFGFRPVGWLCLPNAHRSLSDSQINLIYKNTPATEMRTIPQSRNRETLTTTRDTKHKDL